jgi:hypothetical protein
VDVADDTRRVTSSCLNEFVPVTQLDLDLEEPAVLEQLGDMVREDLGATHCWRGRDHFILYVDETSRVLKVLPKGTKADVIVVVANLVVPAGGAPLDTAPSQTSVIAMGVPVEPIGGGRSRIGGQAHALLAHELAHAFGLLDEYAKLKGIAPPGLKPDRNVWEPVEVPTWNASPPRGLTWPEDERPLPWQQVLADGCTPQTMVRCKGAGPQCELVGVSEEEVQCSFVPRSAYPSCDGCFPPTSCRAFPGAWEGAYYSETKFYRAAERCLMSHPSAGETFCPACTLHLDRYFKE